MGVTGQGVADVHGVRAIGRKRAPGLIGDPYLGEYRAELGGQLPDVDEPAVADGIPLPPGSAGGRGTLVRQGSVG
jgi:hypothetical protein